VLVGVRDNDLKGRDSMDLSQLPLVDGDPGARAAASSRPRFMI
jgi:hypothetical protein